MIAAALLIASPAAADPIACSDAGASIFTRDTHTFPLGEPLPGSSVETTHLAISTTGHWRREARFASHRVDVADGCLDAFRLGELAKALDRARFRATLPRITCRATPDGHVVYASPARGRKVELDEPCRQVLDAGTALLADCADAVTDWSQSDDDVRARCVGAPPLE